MRSKSEYLQIRVTPREKAALKRLAKAAGVDISTYVRSRALPAPRREFGALLGVLEHGEHRQALAELNDFLTRLAAGELREAVADADLTRLSPFLKNYVAAMVEQAAHRKGVPAPRWTAGIAPLAQPYFAAPLKSLRLHLLCASPVPFKRRNLFVDASLGARV